MKERKKERKKRERKKKLRVSEHCCTGREKELTMAGSDEKTYVKVPTFDGRKSQWPFFKSKFRSYLAQKDMVEVLTFSDPIPWDDETWTSEEAKTEEVKLKKKVREQNQRAAGLLLNCIDTAVTKAGESAFTIVEESWMRERDMLVETFS